LKLNYFEKLDFKSFLILIPNDFPSQNNFISHLKGPPLTIESIFYFIVPKNFSTVTELLGYTSLIVIFLFIKNFKKNNNGIILVLLLFILTVLFSQSRPRFYFEIFIWALVYLSFNLKKRNVNNINFLKIISIPQFLTFNILLIYGISNISVGSINKDLREKVLIEKAYGYNIFKWLNSNVPKNAVIISTHRSISLADFDVISGDFIEFMHNKNDRDIKLIELLKDKKPTHIFFMESNNIQNKKHNPNFFVKAGIQACYLVRSHTKFRLGNGTKLKEFDDFALNDFAVHPFVFIQFGNIALFGKYALSQMYEYGASQKNFSFGLSLSTDID
jgi:hypothetical protein